jgi:hypothetical protein
MSEELQPQGSIELPKKEPISDAEWCFQFFNNEPIVFAYSEEGETASSLTLTVQPVEGDGLTFQQNGMEFRFPRPISEKTKLERVKEKENDVR